MIRIAAALLSALALAAPGRTVAADRVVSLNLCADQMLLLLAPEKAVALSPLARDPTLSFVAERAARFPVVRPSAEAVLRLHPDLVLAGEFGAQTTLALLEGSGLRVVRAGLPQSFDAIRAETRKLAGVIATVLTGMLVLDPAIAAAVAVHVLWSGASVIRESVGGLMDAAPAAEIVKRIRAVVGESAEGAIEAHDLRMRHAGKLTFLEFHLVVPGRMTVADAHGICDRIEAALKAEMEGLVITIHVEPEGKAKHHGVLVL